MTVDQGGYPPETGSARALGDVIRSTRVNAGVSVEQVEADLRIKAKYIEAIEDGDAGALPSRAYTDGFLRNYATYLGLDPAETVRRFADENGLAPTRAKSPVSVSMPKAQSNPLNGLSSTPQPRRSLFGMLGRGVAAAMPLVLVGGFAFAGYTGFVAARDAGLIPESFGDLAKKPAQSAAEPSPATDEAGEARVAAVEDTESPVASPAADDDATTAEAETDTASIRRDIVGNESSTGRPDSLSYARTGSTPYWQAKPPAVEPADGPVADIKPETAGLLRADRTERPEEGRSRWSAQASTDTPPADVDASRIAAAAREALVGALGIDAPAFGESVADSSVSEPIDQTEDVETAQLEPQIGELTFDQPAIAAPQPLDVQPEAQFGIGPVVTQEVPFDLAPAEPAQAPRRFALIAASDTWVQVTDAIGTVKYTGILSPGEAYNIPPEQGLRLKTGNAGGLFIEVEGQRFGPLGNSGAVLRNVTLSPGAVRASFTLSQAASLSQ